MHFSTGGELLKKRFPEFRFSHRKLDCVKMLKIHLRSIVALDVESHNFPELQAGFFTNNNLNLWRIIQ